MSDLLGRQALVIGAGMSGLAAAGALAKHFEQVIVLERDRLADRPAHRPGTPQSRQLHGLLAGGLEALCRIFPGFAQDLAAAGAAPLRVGADILEELPGFDPFPPPRLRQRDLCRVSAAARAHPAPARAGASPRRDPRPVSRGRARPIVGPAKHHRCSVRGD
jgi:choline dehydrogenase-like flavoprotein